MPMQPANLVEEIARLRVHSVVQYNVEIPSLQKMLPWREE